MKKTIFALIVSIMVMGCSTKDETRGSLQTESKETQATVIHMPLVMEKVSVKEVDLIVKPVHYPLIMKKVRVRDLPQTNLVVSEFINQRSLEQYDSVSIATAPIPGIYYAALPANDPPLVKVGDRVTRDQTVCYIEAMRMYCAIDSAVSATIAAICKRTGESVEDGEILFLMLE